MKRITTQFALLIATAAVAPLVIYGVVSVTSLRRGTQSSVREGNLRVAAQIAEQVQLYVDNNTRVLRSVGAEVTSTHLEPWQQVRILRDHILAFREFREVSLFDANGGVIATSRLGQTGLAPPGADTPLRDGVYVAPFRVDDDLLPTTEIAIRLAGGAGEPGWVVGEISLEQLWRMVDRIRVGQHGYALIVSEDGRMIAHGDPDEKRRIAENEAPINSPELRFAALLKAHPDNVPYQTYIDENGAQTLAVAARVGTPDWTVVVEQPTEEAYATTYRLERQLTVAILVALLGMVAFGWFWGRSFIRRIFALTRVTRSIAEGHLDARVEVHGQDEIRELGDAFNTMADRLVELQEDVRRQERLATFGRIASGLVHDVLTPVQNIGNNCKMILKLWNDAEYREEFRRIIDSELPIVQRVLSDLRNLAKPMPLERFPLDVNRALGEAVDAMMKHAETAGLTLRAELAPEPLFIEGDLFALGRVYRNLIVNAIQATAPGGLVVAATEANGDRVQVRIYDTGCGIPADRLNAIFEDFVTTKKRGLGLGLAISRKIVEQLEGRISVASEVGKGTTFVLDFPRTDARPVAVAAG
jgi:signal transduction histidine kinase